MLGLIWIPKELLFLVKLAVWLATCDKVEYLYHNFFRGSQKLRKIYTFLFREIL